MCTIPVLVLQMDFAQGHTTRREAELEFKQPALWLQSGAPNADNMKVTCAKGAFYVRHCPDLKASQVHQWKAGWPAFQDSIWTESHV